MVDQRRTYRYSEAFKRQVVEQLESGVLSSITQARRRYGIKGVGTVENWVKRLGKNHLLCKVVRVETPDERHEIERLRKQVRNLEHALAQTRMSQLLAEAQFEVLCRQQGVDPEAQKKKADAQLSRQSSSGPGAKPGPKG
jgi:transposase-like protein